MKPIQSCAHVTANKYPKYSELAPNEPNFFRPSLIPVPTIAPFSTVLGTAKVHCSLSPFSRPPPPNFQAGLHEYHRPFLSVAEATETLVKALMEISLRMTQFLDGVRDRIRSSETDPTAWAAEALRWREATPVAWSKWARTR